MNKAVPFYKTYSNRHTMKSLLNDNIAWEIGGTHYTLIYQ